MSDWRKKPRNGKAEFLAHQSFIRDGLEAGHTRTYLHQVLKMEHNLSLSLSQFNRHVQALLTADQTSNGVTIEHSEPIAEKPRQRISDALPQDISAVTTSSEKPLSISDANTPKPPLTRAGLRQIREGINNLDLNALVTGKGLVARE